jgi:hypothetical protein
MLRRVLVVSLLALGLVGCGGSSATEAPATQAPAASSAAAESSAPTEASASAEPAAMTLTAACDAIGVRKSPSTTGALVARANRGATIHAVDTVSGDSYTVGACGTSGDTWYEIDEINGKTVQSLYGVEFVYSAAGLYK